MLHHTILAAVIASAMSIVNPLQASEEDAPRGVVLDKIEAALADAGFERWEDIERDDDHWDVDDALHGDGHKYDVKIDGETYAILSRAREDCGRPQLDEAAASSRCSCSARSMVWRNTSGGWAPEIAYLRLTMKQGTPWMPSWRA